jgi:hypothetical protein
VNEPVPQLSPSTSTRYVVFCLPSKVAEPTPELQSATRSGASPWKMLTVGWKPEPVAVNVIEPLRGAVHRYQTETPPRTGVYGSSQSALALTFEPGTLRSAPPIVCAAEKPSFAGAASAATAAPAARPATTATSATARARAARTNPESID